MRLVGDAYSHSNFQPPGSGPVTVSGLASWAYDRDDFSEQLQPADYSSLEPARHRTSPFSCADAINSRFVLWYVVRTRERAHADDDK